VEVCPPRSAGRWPEGPEGTPKPGMTALPEPLAFRFEQLLVGDAPSEAQEPGVGDHPVRRAQAAAPHRPTSLEQLEHLEHPEAPCLTQGVEEALHLAHVRTVGEHDPSRSKRGTQCRDGLPWL